MYQRPVCHLLLDRLAEPRRFIQVLAGPRQAGKTTVVRQALAALRMPSHYASADEPLTRDRVWIEQQWEVARQIAAPAGRTRKAVLVLDEIQRVPGWSETVKFLWDQDTARRLPLRVAILGSAPLLVQRGLAESLAGRFETIPVTHWPFAEMRDAFGWGVERFVYYGGYPGAAPLVRDAARWRRYILHSLIETTLSKDVLQMQRVDNPALLRRLFELGCHYSGQVLSLTKMLGQLQDRGNTATLAHYLEMLSRCGLLEGLQKHSAQPVRQRASSPKFQVHNNALFSAIGNIPFEQARANPDHWGRLVESAVGAHLVNAARAAGLHVGYWLDANREVDFVLSRGRDLVAIEVKSSRRHTSAPGLADFAQRFNVTRKLLIGGQGIPLEQFLTTPVEAWF